MYNAAVITVSDRGAKGEREDLSGPVIIDILNKNSIVVSDYTIIPDEIELLSRKMMEFSDVKGLDFIFTTGGTGIAPRDVTPEATIKVLDRVLPGLGEAMRAKSLQITPMAMLSRAVAGVRGKTLIINLPGSPKGATECLEIVLPVLQHANELVKGEVKDCARK